MVFSILLLDRRPHESAGAGGASLFPPLPLPLLRLPEPRVVGVEGFGSGDVTAPKVVSVDGVCCDGRGVDCFGSR